MADSILSNLLDNFDGILDPFELEEPSNHPARSYARDKRAMAGTKVDWVETEDAHIFKVDLPGLTKEDIQVKLVDDRTLKISGERKKEQGKLKEKWHQVERPYGRFLRRLRLPENAKTDAITAKSENGVLTITVPKIPKPELQTKDIEIS